MEKVYFSIIAFLLFLHHNLSDEKKTPFVFNVAKPMKDLHVFNAK